MNGLMRVLLTIFFVSACGLTIAGGDASEGSSDGESETWETTSVSGSGSEYEVEIEIELASDDSSGPRDREWWLDSASDDDWDTMSESGPVPGDTQQEERVFVPADDMQEQCPICLEDLRDLALSRLPCGHGICLACAHDFYVVKRASRSCPLCRRYASRAFVRALAEEQLAGVSDEDVVMPSLTEREGGIRKVFGVSRRNFSANCCKYIMCPVLFGCFGLAFLATMKLHLTGSEVMLF